MVVKPIAEAIKAIKKECVTVMRSYARQMRESIRNAELNYQALPLLHAAGVPVSLWLHSNLDFVVIQLGDRTKGPRAAKRVGDYLRICRQILGPLKISYTAAHSARRQTVEVALRSKDYPGLTITYINKVPAGGKCRVVTETRTKRERSTSLVCSV